jgi:hypothetical protein
MRHHREYPNIPSLFRSTQRSHISNEGVRPAVQLVQEIAALRLGISSAPLLKSCKTVESTTLDLFLHEQIDLLLT